MSMRPKTWIEVSRRALLHNAGAVRRLVEPSRVMAMVKSNAYGHGLVPVASAVQGSVDWFGVDGIDEALALRNASIRKPILILGYTPLERIKDAVRNDVSFVAYGLETVKAARRAASPSRPARIHLKMETGLTRQGVNEKDLRPLLAFLQKAGTVRLEGISTHYANIEDTVDRTYADAQLAHYRRLLKVAKEHGFDPKWKHTACSAAAILFPETRFNLIRLGISLYGLWSSERTEHGARHTKLKLTPAMTWKTIVAQMKRVPKGTPVSYGLTERVERDSLVAVLPVGYWDGFDRGLSGAAHVVVRGKRCKILGRICMNMCMADVTGVPGVRAEDEVVLIGRRGRAEVTADELAGLIGTINYEIVTRVNPLIPRIMTA